MKIIGVLKSGREQNMVTLYRLSTIVDMDKAMAHPSDLRMNRQQQTSISVARVNLKVVQFVAIQFIPCIVSEMAW